MGAQASSLAMSAKRERATGTVALQSATRPNQRSDASYATWSPSETRARPAAVMLRRTNRP
jgi:hypothetical protein